VNCAWGVMVGYPGLYLPDAKETWVGEREADYIMSGPYGVYYDVLRGKLGAINRFVELMRGMDIELEGDAAHK
jgi:hypothetical protein